ncbi:heparin cofactor 2 [Trachemys scripta elegans]|uniref:heparin cofactor 2 n=1 Tax=Trachemys scripta elegans TaxID=31138 RepID=UPI0015578932|nr:heparin cofactor 2 [Trachemys scripta elegans]XP_053862086.1 heparin cofactor 2 [Malaclemys terrapin pileata]
MKLLFHLFVLSFVITSAFCGIKDFNKHFESIDQAINPRSPHENETHNMPNFPPGFHKANTITNDLIAEEDEEEDYLDLEKIFDEDYYGDIIDASPYPYMVAEIQQGNILELFPGKTRIQRLNILNANFGFNLYRSLKDRANSSDNILMAPVGISTAMAMISLGLKGQTHQEVLSVLGFRDFINASSKYEIMTIHNLFRKLTHRLFRRNFGYTLRSVNDLYIRKQFSIMDDFRNNMKNYYFAEAQSSDFSDPAFITKTNERILKLTKGLIKEALVNINPTTLMMILNCIYFKGTWENKFPVEMTNKRTFRLNEKETIKVPMMQTKGNFLAAADHELDCGVLQLPYVGNISMLIVLPNKLSGMKALEKQLTPQVVEKWQKSMTNRTREVVLPKFKLEKSYDLTDYLKSMGIETLFDNNGDYSGVSTEKVIIDVFNHQGTITVNEEGTEAAAVTTVGFMPLSTQIRFVVDRPFLFLIYEHRTSCLLFMGRVANPSKF